MVNIKKISLKKNLPPRRHRENDLQAGAKRRASSTQALQPNLFRRNRTFVGSPSRQVQSAETSGDIESPRAKAHRLVARRRKLLAICIVLLSISLALFLLVRQFVATPTVEISNQKDARAAIDTKPYVAAINTYLAHNPLQRFRFSLNQSALSEALVAANPEVDQILAVKPASLGRATVSISLRRPVAVWQIDGTNYFVDHTGASFKRNFFAQPAITVTDNTGARVKQGDMVTSSSLLSFIGKVITGSQVFGYSVKTVSLPTDTTRQVVVTVVGHSSQIILSIDRPVGGQLEDMSVALKYLDKNNLHPSYIDVRVSGKAFYK